MTRTKVGSQSAYPASTTGSSACDERPVGTLLGLTARQM